MPPQRLRLFPYIVSVIVLLAITLPYLIAYQSAGEEYVFRGILLNPMDGNSYLAKMYQGWRGEWLFTLPFTAEQGKGAILFPLYLLLGHLARFFNLSLPLVYHLARLSGAVALLSAMWRFFGAVLPNERTRRAAFLLAALGSGMGWIVVVFAGFTSDFWVAEAYPFLSAYMNPHFPWGMALLLWILTPLENDSNLRTGFLWRFFLSLTLALIQPFGVAIALLALGSWVAWEVLLIRPPGVQHGFDYLPRFRASLKKRQALLIGLLIGGIPPVIYDFWVMGSDPLFSGWNRQNLTPSPALWDLGLSTMPALLLAIIGIISLVHSAREGVADNAGMLAAWVIFGIIALYLPLSLQRRLMTALYVPVAGLAGLGLVWISDHTRRSLLYWTTLALALSLPTNLMILLAVQHVALTHEPLLYMTRGEAQALEWIEQNTPPEALILAAPETGLIIPADTGRRVIYGHPFETVGATQREASLNDFFRSGMDALDFIVADDLDQGVYLFFGPREAELSAQKSPTGLSIVYRDQDVTIYQVAP